MSQVSSSSGGSKRGSGGGGPPSKVSKSGTELPGTGGNLMVWLEEVVGKAELQLYYVLLDYTSKNSNKHTERNGDS
jgi:hypothetical protein